MEAPRMIIMGFKGGTEVTGLSERTLRYAAEDPDPAKRLKTVWYGRRRLIRLSDLEDWLSRVVKDEKSAAYSSNPLPRVRTQSQSAA
jgi:hypothetical protein